MAKPGWGPLLPLQGGRAELCLLGTWPSQVGPPYYPYRGTRGIQPFGLMDKPAWGPLLPLREGGDGWLVGWRVGWWSGGVLNLRTAIP